MALAKVPTGSKVCVSTHVGRKEDDEGTIIMTIEDIKTKMGSTKPGDGIESAVMECGDMEFKLKVYPNGTITAGPGTISVQVIVSKSGKRQWKKFEFFTAENSMGAFLKTQTSLLEVLLKKNEAFVHGQAKHLLPHIMVLAPQNSSFFPNGVLTVKVNITVQGEEIVSHKTTKVPDESITPFQLSRELAGHLRKMFESHQFSDLQIICHGEIIPCHRSMLAARSDVFEAMFRFNDVEENKTVEVVIDDFNLETVKAVVLHIYTGEVELTEENTEQLIKAADYYQLHGLKKKTEDALVKMVKTENAIDMFVLGDAVHANKLRDVSKEVIVSNAVAIVKIDGWREALGRFPELTLEIFESVVNGKDRIK